MQCSQALPLHQIKDASIANTSKTIKASQDCTQDTAQKRLLGIGNRHAVQLVRLNSLLSVVVELKIRCFSNSRPTDTADRTATGVNGMVACVFNLVPPSAMFSMLQHSTATTTVQGVNSDAGCHGISC